MVVYPNKMDFPVMENFGKAPLPLGMVEVTIQRAEGLPNSDLLSKSDPFVEARPASVFCWEKLRVVTTCSKTRETWQR